MVVRVFDFATWGSGGWGLLVAVLALLGISGPTVWNGAKRFGRKSGLIPPEPPVPPQPVQIIDPDRPKHPGFPPIRPPADHRRVVGREEDLKDLRTKLASCHNAQITSAGATIQGEGGRGKSTLARYYAEKMGGTYDGGAWVAAQGRAGIFEDLAAFGATAFNLTTPDPIPASHIKDILNRISTSPARLLFVFDNVDDYADVRDYLPKGDAVDIILTTRLTGGFEGFETLALDVLKFDTPDSPAVTLLLDAADQPLADAATRTKAQGLAEVLGGMPLALVIAGALAKEGASFAELATRLGEIIATKPPNDAYPTSIAAAVETSYNRLSADAQLLAGVLAWLAPSDIEFSLFEDAPKGPAWKRHKTEVPKSFVQLCIDAIRLRRAWSSLRQNSFLQGDDSREMHRLTSSVLRSLKPEDAEVSAKTAAAMIASVYPQGRRHPKDPENWDDCRKLSFHVVAIWTHAEPLWANDWVRPGWPSLDNCLHQCGVFFGSQDNKEMEVLCKRASLRLMRARLDETDPLLALSMGNLAIALARTGKIDEANGLIDDAVRMDEELRPNSRALAIRYLQFGTVQSRRSEQGDSSGLLDGEEKLNKALSFFESSGVRGRQDVAVCLDELGVCYGLQDREVESAKAFEKALAIRRGWPNIPPDQLARSAQNVGSSYLRAGKWERAEELLREAFDRRQAIYEDTPEHSALRHSAQWLIFCLLVKAEKGIDRVASEAEAALLSKEFDLDFDRKKAHARRLAHIDI